MASTHPSFRQRLYNLRWYERSQSQMGWLTSVIRNTWLSPSEVPMNVQEWKTLKKGADAVAQWPNQILCPNQILHPLSMAQGSL